MKVEQEAGMTTRVVVVGILIVSPDPERSRQISPPVPYPAHLIRFRLEFHIFPFMTPRRLPLSDIPFYIHHSDFEVNLAALVSAIHRLKFLLLAGSAYCLGMTDDELRPFNSHFSS